MYHSKSKTRILSTNAKHLHVPFEKQNPRFFQRAKHLHVPFEKQNPNLPERQNTYMSHSESKILTALWKQNT